MEILTTVEKEIDEFRASLQEYSITAKILKDNYKEYFTTITRDTDLLKEKLINIVNEV